jgi:hypothetical protein
MTTTSAEPAALEGSAPDAPAAAPGSASSLEPLRAPTCPPGTSHPFVRLRRCARRACRSRLGEHAFGEALPRSSHSGPLHPTPSDWVIAAAAERVLMFSYRAIVSAARPPGIDLGGCQTEFQAGFVTSTTSAPLTALPNEAAARFVLALSANCPLCTSFSPFLFSTTNRNLSPLLRISIFPATVRLPFARMWLECMPFQESSCRACMG